jgi:phage-related protein
MLEENSDPYHDPRLLKDLKGRPVHLPSIAEHLGNFEEAAESAENAMSSVKAKIDNIRSKIYDEGFNDDFDELEEQCQELEDWIVTMSEDIQSILINYKIQTKPLEVKQVSDIDVNTAEGLK